MKGNRSFITKMHFLPGYGASRIQWLGLVFLILLLSSVACTWVAADILTFDPLPKEAEKGYVEFSSPGSAHSGVDIYTYSIYENLYERKVDAFPIQIWSGNQKRRIAKQPGTYTFIVSMGGLEKEVTVDIKPGMVTPVTVNVITLGARSVYKGKEYSFTILLQIGEAFPHKHEENEFTRTKPIKSNVIKPPVK